MECNQRFKDKSLLKKSVNEILFFVESMKFIIIGYNFAVNEYF